MQRRIVLAACRRFIAASKTVNSRVSFRNYGYHTVRRFYSNETVKDAEIVDTKAANEDVVVDAEAEEVQNEELRRKGLIEETEQPSGEQEVRDFQAETRQLLDIVASSLYTDKEVFVRELISNSSDALEKLRHLQVTGQPIEDPDKPLEISIAVDDQAHTFTIQDSGIGMTHDELIECLGTIARSGSKNFLKQLHEAGQSSANAAMNIIGQFGVGFYSAFMVANRVRVYTRSSKEGSKGYCWESYGAGSYSISEAEGVARGTKIILSLKPSEKDFSIKENVERIIKKYSNFVSYNISLNGSKVNTLEALWMKDASEITDEQHKDFYKYISHSSDDPFFRLQFKADVPLNIHSLFYFPRRHTEKHGMGKMDYGVNLYSRKVLIQPKSPLILPDWLRFVKGVVDSADIPLNLSREHLQDSALVRRLNSVLTKRILKHLTEQCKNDPEKYREWFDEFGQFVKEGIVTDMLYKDELSKLLIYETSKTEPGKKITLDQYVARMKDDQKDIYYLHAPNRQSAMTSPYFEAFKKKDIEVIFTHHPADEVVFPTLFNFKGKTLVSAESASFDIESSKPGLSELQANELADWLKSTLQLDTVKPTKRVAEFPAIIADQGNVSMRRIMRQMQQDFGGDRPKLALEFNPSHPIMVKLYQARIDEPETAKAVADQVYDNALIAVGLLDDSRAMLPRINQFLEQALKAVKSPIQE